MAVRVAPFFFVLALEPFTSRAQLPPARGPAAADLEVISIDPCPVASLDQFRFLLGAGLGRSLPSVRTTDGGRVTVSSLVVVTVTCAPMRAELTGELERLPPTPTRDSSVSTVHFTTRLLGKASFPADSGRTPRTPAMLSGARLCLGASEVTRTESRAGRAIDRTSMRAALNEALRDRCFDITSLVYVFLQRGGTLSPPRS
jgi:hypothetical protein